MYSHKKQRACFAYAQRFVIHNEKQQQTNLNAFQIEYSTNLRKIDARKTFHFFPRTLCISTTRGYAWITSRIDICIDLFEWSSTDFCFITQFTLIIIYFQRKKLIGVRWPYAVLVTVNLAYAKCIIHKKEKISSRTDFLTTNSYSNLIDKA